MSETSSNICPNCSAENDQSSKFCASCGQKIVDSRITFSDLWSEFQDAVFNIESRTWKTLKYLFIPGKLTLEYFEGKRRRYVHPLRLLIVSSALVIIAMSFHGLQSSKNHQYDVEQWILKNYERKQLFKTVANITDEAATILPGPQTELVTDTIMSALRDSINKMLVGYPRRDGYGVNVDLNTYASFFDEGSELVSKKDFLYMDADKMVAKYKKDASSLDQLIFKQKLKVIKDESSMFSGMIGYSSWAALLMMPCFALALFMLYYRRGYYIEHLIFTFHIHSFVFLVLALMILGMNIIPTWLFASTMAMVWVYIFLSLRNVYGQGIIKLSLKFLILTICYIVLFVLFFFGTIIVVFLLL